MPRKNGLAAAILFMAATPMYAEKDLDVAEVLTPAEPMRFGLGDGSAPFELAVQRDGVTESDSDGDFAIIRWVVRAVFVKGDKQPRLIGYGHWEHVFGTGTFDGMRGVGTLTFKPAGGPARAVPPTREIAPAP